VALVHKNMANCHHLLACCKTYIVEQGWQPLLDIVREMACYEDFEEWNTRVRIDFLGKWYHTRVKKVKTFSY
jgi:hypothetical protein